MSDSPDQKPLLFGLTSEQIRRIANTPVPLGGWARWSNRWPRPYGIRPCGTSEAPQNRR